MNCVFVFIKFCTFNFAMFYWTDYNTCYFVLSENMTFEPKMSRFAVLPDDVPEPIAKSSGDKPRKKKPADQKAKVGPVGDAAKKKGSAAKGKVLLNNNSVFIIDHLLHWVCI